LTTREADEEEDDLLFEIDCEFAKIDTALLTADWSPAKDWERAVGAANTPLVLPAFRDGAPPLSIRRKPVEIAAGRINSSACPAIN
jgi:hypothetical protein